MVLVLTEAEARELISLRDIGACVEAVASAYRALGAGAAMNLPRGRLRFPLADGAHHYFLNVIPGAVPALDVCAVRLDSATYEAPPGVPRAQRRMRDDRFTGLVLLFGTSTGELLAILPDFTISGLRVGALSGTVAAVLARTDAARVGLFGTGKQARSNLAAVCAVRGVRQVVVYSPNAAHRTEFAAEMTDALGVEVRPASTPREVVAGADVVVCATNTSAPVFEGAWLEPGQHVVSIVGGDRYDERREVDAATVARAGLVAMNSVDQARLDAQDALPDPGALPPAKLIEVGPLLAGTGPGRADRDQITLHLNNTGQGIQFAAVGAMLYERARAAGRGHELPAEWFTTDLSSYAARGYHPSP
jgi:ornithine cyclodeaminase/alanine dehydrogenase-like protein (mu-crystallin family)